MKAYKILTKDMTSPFDNVTKWELGKITKVSKDKKLMIEGYGLHLYKSLDNVSIGKFGPRIFEAEVVSEHIEDKDKVCTYEVKLTKELKPEIITDSVWAFYYCKDIKDNPKVRKNITESGWAYHYCANIKDNPKVRKNITDSGYAYRYCKYVKDNPKVAKYITDSVWSYRYCKDVKDRPKIRKNITESRYSYFYCRDVKDRPEIRKNINNEYRK